MHSWKSRFQAFAADDSTRNRASHDFLTRALRGLITQFVAKHSQMLFASKAKAIAEIHKTNVSMINLVILENSVQSQQMLLTE